MKTILLFLTAVLLGFNVQAASVAVPSLGQAIRTADTIAKGRLSVDGSNVLFLVESRVKGKYQPSRAIRIAKNRDDIFFDLVRYAVQLQGQPCFILGVDRNDEIYLPWNAFSVWPQGISNEWSIFEDIDKCATFIDTLVKYERLESYPNTLLTSLLNDLQADSFRHAVLAYLNSSPNLFRNDRSLERDVLSVVAAHISSRRIFDEWTAHSMRSLSPSMPQSITIPYFMEVVKKGGTQGDLAQASVEAALRARGLVDHDVNGRVNLSAAVEAALPKLRIADAQRNTHLFDAINGDIAASAGLVFGEIFSESRPNGKGLKDEKTFWMNRISDRQK
jgi:hypothetical protein